MVDVSLLESFPSLTSFYGNGRTKFPKNSWTAIIHNFVIDLGSGESGSLNSSGARQLCSFTGASPPPTGGCRQGGSSRSETLDFGNVSIDERTVTAGKF